MAELVVSNIAKSLLQQLSSPAKDEFLLWFNSNTELEKLKNTITSIKGVLHDAEQKKATNNDIRGWLSRLQDEMYKADDLFDTISTRVLRKKVISGNKFRKEIMIFFSKSNQAAFIVKTAHKVKELREQLDAIAKDICQFGLIRSTIEYEQRTAIKRKTQHSFITEDEVIGREKDKQELLKLLMADAGVEERVSVIAVVGIGGQGKTALAQLLYNAKEIEEFFELRLWACVNDFSDLKEALEEITSTKSHSLDKLQNRLREKIHGKRFLLVIDDVWDDIREQWLGLKRLLYAGESGSKVLLTTRSQTVAQNLATVRPHYALGELLDEDAWILFKKMAFDNNEGEEEQTKKELGRQIFKKCPKVPLAIRTVGSFLYSKDKKKWLAFVDNELMKAMPDPANIVMQVLKISYDDLPSSLKHCFAYCSLFPKDHEFDKTTLIHLWMAQGLLDTSDENPCLEEVGETYFFYLVQRGFFQNLEVDDAGDIISCKMHDLFHDMAVQIAGSQCQALLKVTDELGRKFPRHLLVKEITETLLQCKGLRSLVSPVTGFVDRVLLDGVFLNLTSLRTLSLRQVDVEEIPSSIGKLLHLRYLDLKNSEKLIKLPDAICKLQNLLILRLDGCKNLIKLPNDLQKLVSLRYLKIRGCEKLNHIPLGMEKMTSLATLDQLIVHYDHGGLRCLKHLNNLTGDICIRLPSARWKNCVEDAEESMLCNKTKLSRLSIVWDLKTKEEELSDANAVLDTIEAEELSEAVAMLDTAEEEEFVEAVAILDTTEEEEFFEAVAMLDTTEEEEFPKADAVLDTTREEGFFEADTVLDRLQPSNGICQLKVKFFPGVKFPDWLSSLHNLVKLTLYCCSRGLELPQLRHLSQLKRLKLFSIPLLEYVENDICNDSIPFFPSLECLKIAHLSRLKGWWRPVGEEVSGAYDSWFPRLSRLHIFYCPKLTSLPLCLSLEDLTVEGVSANLVTQIVRLSKVVEQEASSSSLVPTSNILLPYTCSKLNVLSLHNIDDLAFLAEDFKNLSGVRRLLISSCRNFKRSSLFFLLQHLPYLETLESRCLDATESSIDVENMGNDGMQWRSLTRLKSLEFEFGKDTLGGHLLRGLHHLTRLEKLMIYMHKVPIDEDMQWTAPPNLKYLSVMFMDKVASLKSVIHQLKNLQSLQLGCCESDEHELNMLPWEDLKGLRKLIFFSNLEMRSLPEKCRHLLALEDLHIRYSCKITSLPDWVSRLTSLEIYECSKLKEACRKPMGSCWPLIRDIPYISISEFSYSP